MVAFSRSANPKARQPAQNMRPNRFFDGFKDRIESPSTESEPSCRAIKTVS
jgi:hypothetical protein